MADNFSVFGLRTEIFKICDTYAGKWFVVKVFQVRSLAFSLAQMYGITDIFNPEKKS
jgi:hypothetical protein